MADVLSQITTHLGPEAMQAILDGATIGASQRAEGENPTAFKLLGEYASSEEGWMVWRNCQNFTTL